MPAVLNAATGHSRHLIGLSAADAPEIANLYARCADYFLLQDGVVPTLDDADALFTDVPLESPPRDQMVLGWSDGGKLEAVAAILRDYPRRSIWYLGFMIVDEERRGCGLGRSLYAEIERLAAGDGAQEIRLAALEANMAAERFWTSCGFEERRRVGPDSFKTRRHRRIEFARSIANDRQGSGR